MVHSDRGVQYASKVYQKLLGKQGFICSMSRKGNCYDNAPMESFWGKLKTEWLNDYRFKTRDEASILYPGVMSGGAVLCFIFVWLIFRGFVKQEN